jgi:hypothetical protein
MDDCRPALGIQYQGNRDKQDYDNGRREIGLIDIGVQVTSPKWQKGAMMLSFAAYCKQATAEMISCMPELFCMRIDT